MAKKDSKNNSDDLTGQDPAAEDDDLNSPEDLVTETERLVYYPGKKPRESYALKNGKKHGEACYYEEDGSVSKKENYKDDQLHGETTAFIDGKKTETIIYSKGQAIERIDYHDNGKILSRAPMKKGGMEGLVVGYDEAGRVMEKGSYKNDQLDGESVYYNDEGEVDSSANFKKGKLDGEVVSYLRGQVVCKMIVKNGKKNGAFINYQDGKMTLQQTYKNDKLNGKSVIYEPTSGLPMRVMNYADDVLHGELVDYFAESKQVQERTSYKNGKKHGDSERFYETGKPMDIRKFKNGVQTGDTIFYDYKGREKIKPPPGEDPKKRSAMDKISDAMIGREK